MKPMSILEICLGGFFSITLVERRSPGTTSNLKPITANTSTFDYVQSLNFIEKNTPQMSKDKQRTRGKYL